MPKVCIKGNGTVDVEEGASYLDALRKAGYGELDQVLAVKVDGELRDLTAPVNGDCEVEPVTFRDSEGREVYWHSTAHIMAAAVKELFPTAKVTIGPPVETGFYYDFD